jgi:hypothetical protein
MANLGPMLGRNHHFKTYAAEKIPYAINGHGTSERWFGQSGETRHGEGSGLNVASGGGEGARRTGSYDR